MQRTCSKSPRDTKGSLAIQASLSFATRSWKYRWSVHKAAVILMMRAAVSHTVLGGRRAGRMCQACKSSALTGLRRRGPEPTPCTRLFRVSSGSDNQSYNKLVRVSRVFETCRFQRFTSAAGTATLKDIKHHSVVSILHHLIRARVAEGTVLAGPGEELSRFLEAHVLLGTFSGPRFALQLW